MSNERDRDELTDRLLGRAFAAGGTDAGGGALCLDAETIAAWADGGLDKAAAARAEAHLSSCANCQALLAAVAITTPAEEHLAPVVVPFWRRFSLQWLVPMTAGVVTVLVWSGLQRGQPGQPPVEEFKMARAEDAIAPPSPAIVPAPTPSQATAPGPASAAPTETRGQAVGSQGNRIAATASDEAAPLRQEKSVAGEMGATSRAAALPAPGSATVAPASLPPPPESLRAFGSPQAAISGGSLADVREATAATTAELGRMSGNALGVVAEFGAPLTAARSAGAAAGRDGRGGFGQAPVAPAATSEAVGAFRAEAVAVPSRWRVHADGTVSRLVANASTWQAVSIVPAVHITNGAAPVGAVVWLVGRGGVVLRSVDGATFVPVTRPTAVDLVSIVATNSAVATVATADGRAITTNDGGQTWR